MRTGLRIAAIIFLCAGAAEARTIHIDSRIGNDAYDGTSASVLNAYVGPVKTLERGVQLVERGDTLVLVDNGTPYYGSVELFGPRFSGTEGQPFRLQGNGAVISGTKLIHPDSWVEVDQNLWRITPIRKGWYQLIENAAALPRVGSDRSSDTLPEIPVGSWAEWKGAIYLRMESGDVPRLHEFELAERATGLSLVGVRNAVISDVTFQHFRVDGINAHDRCDGVTLMNVSCRENGRAGLVVGGTCRVQVTQARIEGNAEHSLLIRELGEAAVSDSEYDIPPTVAE